MIHPVLLCGGSGTRLWPLSRQNFPKQFVRIVGDETLFQASAERLSGEGFASPIVVTSDQLRHVAIGQLGVLGINPKAVLVEPQPRNTAPAVLAAALWLLTTEEDPLMLVAPSDHVIPDAERFRASVSAALPSAMEGKIVAFGIVPTTPETGYSYLELSGVAERKDNTPQPVARFVEKPDIGRATSMLLAGNCLWNAGIFLFKARKIVTAFEEHAPEMVVPVRNALADARHMGNVLSLASEPWSNVPDASIDYAIMERARNLSVMPYEGRWSDLGSWRAVWQESSPDLLGNVVQGNSLAIDCERTMLRSEGESLQIVAIGLRDIIAVATGDAILVVSASDTQRVKDAAHELKLRGAKQATSFAHDQRPWGQFESLANGARYHVKRILVDPGASLSLQSHRHRSEHWIVVQGTAKVTVNENVKILNENESAYIPLGAIHRLENPGADPLVLIEIQTGTYFGEDDIIRYQDIYARI